MPPVFLLRKFLFCILLIWISGCQTSNDSYQKTSGSERTSLTLSKEKESETNKLSKPDPSHNVPEKVFTVLNYVRKYNKAPEGYTGGKRFGNYEKHLPLKDQNAKPMQYREWDVNPKKKGRNRGAERLVTSKNDRAWYTRDHYDSFIEIE